MEHGFIRDKSLSEKVYDILKQAIINDEFSNDKINIDEIASNLRISRTPVINALKTLQRENYVTIAPQSGTYVKELTKSELQTIYELRAVIEGLAIKLALPEIDKDELREFLKYFEAQKESPVLTREKVMEIYNKEMEFHDFLISHSNEIIEKTLVNLVDLTKRYRRRALMNKFELKDETFEVEIKTYIERHCALIKALLSGDIEKAGKAIIEHIKNRTFYIEIAGAKSQPE